MAGLSYSDIEKINNNVLKKAVLNNSKELDAESIIGEVYLFKTHGNFTKEDMALFMLECGIPKKRVAAFTGFSRRKTDQLTERVKIGE